MHTPYLSHSLRFPNGPAGRRQVTPQGFHKCSAPTPGGNYVNRGSYPPIPQTSVRYNGILFCRVPGERHERCLASVGASGLGETEAVDFLGGLPSFLSSNLDQVWLRLLLIERCGIGGGVPLGASWMNLKSSKPRVC